MTDAPGEKTPKSADTIRVDLPCLGCGYNLKTLSRAGVCAECGLAVEQTLALVEMKQAELGELRACGNPSLQAMHRGLKLAIAAWWLTLPQLFAEALPRSHPFHNAAVIALSLTPFVVGHLAAFHLFGALSETKRRAMRGLAILGPLGLGLVFINTRWSAYYGYQFASSMATRIEHDLPLAAIGRVFIIAMPIVVAVAGGQLVRVARLAHRKTSVAIGLITGLNILITGFWSLALSVSGSERVAASELLTVVGNPTLLLGLAPTVIGVCLGQWFDGRIYDPLLAAVGLIATGVHLFILHVLANTEDVITRAILLNEEAEASSRS